MGRTERRELQSSTRDRTKAPVSLGHIERFDVQNEGNSGDRLGVQNEGNWSEECRVKHGQPSSANDRPTIKLHS